MSTPITAAQARYIADLASRLGYARTDDMWREYGYIEETAFGPKHRSISKAAASALISQLKNRLQSKP